MMMMMIVIIRNNNESVNRKAELCVGDIVFALKYKMFTLQ